MIDTQDFKDFQRHIKIALETQDDIIKECIAHEQALERKLNTNIKNMKALNKQLAYNEHESRIEYIFKIVVYLLFIVLVIISIILILK